ncbi:MAG: AsmA-like C-terminal region-containing protein [Bacteroidetes bacterium]|nr:AsmA-like C-terminal region-containing protein [Bacteroidota bacterium]
MDISGGTKPQIESKKKRSRFTKIVKGFFIGLLIILLLIVSGGFMIGCFYGDEVKAYVIQQLNTQLNTRVVVDPHNIRFSVIRNFPSASVDFNHVLALDAITWKDKNDTLFSAGTISLQFSIVDIFRKNYKIRKLYLADVVVKVKVYKNGKDNYHFWKATDSSSSDKLSFVLDKIRLKNVSVQYDDKQSKQFHRMTISKGSLAGKLSEERYELYADLQLYIDRISSDSTIYLKDKMSGFRAGISINSKTQTYSVNNGKIKLADMNFDLDGNITYPDSTTTFDLQLKGRDLDIRSVLSLMPKKYKDKIEDYSSEGNFYFEAAIKGKYTGAEVPLITSRFGIENGDIRQTRSDLAFKQVQLHGQYSNLGNSKLTIDKFSGKLDEGLLNGYFSIENFDNPYINLGVNAEMNLNNFQKFMQIDTVESLAGRAILNLTYKGKLPRGKSGKSFVSEDLKKAVTSGNLELSDVSMRFKNSSNTFDSINGAFLFDNSNIVVNRFSGYISGSDFSLKGFARNILPYLFLDNEDLTIEAQFNSDKLDLDQLLVDEEKTTRRDTVYELAFSEHLHLDLSSHIKELNFRHFRAREIKGQIVLEDKRMSIDPISFEAMDGKINGRGAVDGSRGNKIIISCTASLKRVNINRLFAELENFGQATFTDKNIKGFLTSEIQYISEWSPKLEANLNKVYATADIKIEKGEILNFEPLKAFSKFINVKELENIKFATLENQIQIRDQVIFIPKMDMKNSALNLICSGKHTFNNEIDYHIQLLMRELLAKKAGEAKSENKEFGEMEDDGLSRSLFISMTGTVDDPIIKYDKRGMFQKIKDDIKKQKQNLKDLLREEFGWFKKDSTKVKDQKEEKKREDKFNIKWDEKDKDDKKEDEDF